MRVLTSFGCGRSGARYQKTSHTSSGGASNSIENSWRCTGGLLYAGVMSCWTDAARSSSHTQFWAKWRLPSVITSYSHQNT